MVDVTELVANKVLKYFSKIMYCFLYSGKNTKLMQWT